jgi:hypothetical protein
LVIQGELVQVCQCLLGIFGKYSQRCTDVMVTFDGIFGLIKGGTAGMVGPRLAPPARQMQLQK